MSQFLIRLNGTPVPKINVLRGHDGGNELAVMIPGIGWFQVPDRRDLVLEYRCEDDWNLLPIEMRRDSIDKGWNKATPEELIGVLYCVGVLH